jgi:hypothetical protein
MAKNSWEQIHNQTGLTNLPIFRVGDRPLESSLPQGMKPEIISRYEFFANSLANHIQQHYNPEIQINISDTLTSVFQDTIALATTLDSCFILTCLSPQEIEGNPYPSICIAMNNWGIPCQVISKEDEIAAIERNYLHKLIIKAGLAKFFWSGLEIAILHILTPTNLPITDQQCLFSDNYILRQKINPWELVRCFLYQL